jgi:multicomponent Na+:H+ antiporter subunit D
MIGVPPTAGFLGKWLMLSGAMEAGQWLAVGVIILSTLLNAAYFLPIVVSAFFREPDHNPHPDSHAHGEAPWPIVLALTATAIGAIGLFCLPGIPLALSNMMLAG